MSGNRGDRFRGIASDGERVLDDTGEQATCYHGHIERADDPGVAIRMMIPQLVTCHSSQSLSLSEVLADVLPHLVVPIGPFVAAFRAPVVQVVRDSAAS